MPRRLTIDTGRHPHEVLICVAAVFVGGMGLLLDTSTSPSITATLVPPWRTLYYAVILASGGSTLFGVIRHGISGLLVERVGLAVMGLLFFAFGVAILMVSGMRGFSSATIPMCAAGANIVRAVQISKDLKRLKTHLSAVGGGPRP